MSMIAMPTLILVAEAEAALALPTASGIRFVRMSDWESFITTLRTGCPAGYIAVERLDRPLHALLARILREVPLARLVVGVADPDSAIGVPPIVSDQIVAVAPMPDPQGLQWAVRVTWFEGRVEGMRRWAASGRYHWLTNLAIRKTLAERPPRAHRPGSARLRSSEASRISEIAVVRRRAHSNTTVRSRA